MITIPAMALERVRFEIGHMGEIISEMISRLDAGLLDRDRRRFDDVVMLDDKVDILNDAILAYLSRLPQRGAAAASDRPSERGVPAADECCGQPGKSR
jgi:Na+/phosphate symporter